MIDDRHHRNDRDDRTRARSNECAREGGRGGTEGAEGGVRGTLRRT